MNLICTGDEVLRAQMNPLSMAVPLPKPIVAKKQYQ